MSLTLADAEARVRARTRHTNDTARLTSAVCKELLHTAYVELRAQIQVIVPQLYLAQSPDLALPDGQLNQIDTSNALARYASLYRVERMVNDIGWRVVERGSDENPNEHQTGSWTFTRQGVYINLGPDRFTGITVRVFYHQVPDVLVNPTDVFEIPDITIPVLLLKTIAWVTFQDTVPMSAAIAAKKAVDDLADAELAKITPTLKQEYGVHAQRSGLRMVVAR